MGGTLGVRHNTSTKEQLSLAGSVFFCETPIPLPFSPAASTHLYLSSLPGSDGQNTISLAFTTAIYVRRYNPHQHACNPIRHHYRQHKLTPTATTESIPIQLSQLFTRIQLPPLQ
ncbi:hypothetical protein E2C01_087865 [Portunus trituberculatus]|uniref:Uncharacterized protein n=1 Tax=Portunus trituberculatus TaxID=210409 RepID=A0A5B7JD00_PORTR|nr:hypothetical protein [Portunus trituberculatus]